MKSCLQREYTALLRQYELVLDENRDLKIANDELIKCSEKEKQKGRLRLIIFIVAYIAIDFAFNPKLILMELL